MLYNKNYVDAIYDKYSPIFQKNRIDCFLALKNDVSTELIACSLYIHSNSFFLKNNYVLDDVHYDMVKNNLIIMKPILKPYFG